MTLASPLSPRRTCDAQRVGQHVRCAHRVDELVCGVGHGERGGALWGVSGGGTQHATDGARLGLHHLRAAVLDPPRQLLPLLVRERKRRLHLTKQNRIQKEATLNASANLGEQRKNRASSVASDDRDGDLCGVEVLNNNQSGEKIPPQQP